ncbi:hypothetical protein C8R44DRAFT_637013 [Mycena epipterygia]|nr:hypothetical protein C8R44DRAFT_637013 [Mycena epipterygia]
MSHGTPPVIPQELRPYNSYVEDPKWQIRFTVIWCSVVAFGVVLAMPRMVRGLRTGSAFSGLAGVRVAALYAPLVAELGDDTSTLNSRQSTIVEDAKIGAARVPMHWTHTAASLLSSFALWSVPGIDLNLGQMFVVMAYSAFSLVCIILKAPLMSNPNRPGFLALAQLPPVFLFAMKNSPVALLFGPGVDYTKLNYVHRWAGRGLFLGAVIHGSLWIQNHLTYNLPILSQQKEGSGVAALACLCVIVLSSVAPLRRWCYSLFLVIHYLTFPAFFVTICYHTPFVYPWIFPPVAFYAFDVLLRVLKFRVVVARVRACDGGLSVISISAAATGWRAGQHVQVRALVGGGTFAQSHPLSILCAPPDTTCLSPPPGLLLAARACGPWSRALHAFGSDHPPIAVPDAEKAVVHDDDGADELEEDFDFEEVTEGGRAMHVILDGPYGGPMHDAGAYDTVLFIAGGSGVTVTLGQLDDLVGRCVRRGRAHGERTRRVEWVWCVRDADALNWFAPQLAQIAAVAARPSSGLVLSIRVFVTGAVGGAAVTGNASDVPGCEVCVGRPTARALLNELMYTEGSLLSAKDTEHGAAQAPAAGGFAVFAAGPGGLVREAGNAAARVNLLKRAGIDFCAEAFVI